MKKKLYLIRNISGIASLLLMGACRSAEPENNLSGSGSSAVSFNLSGTEYAESDRVAGQAAAKSGTLNSENPVQRHSLLLSPSRVITTELSPSTEESNLVPRTSAGINAVAAVPGNPLAPGAMFRIIAYRNNGNYHIHQDYTVGQTALPMMLDNGKPYTIVVYSFGTPSLPAISTGETNNISSATVNYNDASRDFMYQSISFTPVNANNTLTITLRHQIAYITTIISSTIGDITNITSGKLTPHYTNGTFSLSSGMMSGRTATSEIALNFSSAVFPGKTYTASPVFLNNDTGGNATGGFSATITIKDVTNTITTKAISLPNSFKVTPGGKSTLTFNMSKCGAYIGPNTNPANFKEFMCHNLGANTNADPFIPAAAVHGAKYQWGAQTGEKIGRAHV